MKDEPTLGVVIVDDEAPARLLLREYLAGEPDCRLVAECANGFEAVRAVHELKPDLLLLDIQMPKLDGFEVLDVLGGEAPAVVFVTAHDEHALRAFEVHAVDYLLKPVSPERFSEAMARARERRRRSEAAPIRQLAAAARPPGARLERVVVRDGARVHVIPIDKLDYAEEVLVGAFGGRLPWEFADGSDERTSRESHTSARPSRSSSGRVATSTR